MTFWPLKIGWRQWLIWSLNTISLQPCLVFITFNNRTNEVKDKKPDIRINAAPPRLGATSGITAAFRICSLRLSPPDCSENWGDGCCVTRWYLYSLPGAETKLINTNYMCLTSSCISDAATPPQPGGNTSASFYIRNVKCQLIWDGTLVRARWSELPMRSTRSSLMHEHACRPFRGSATRLLCLWGVNCGETSGAPGPVCVAWKPKRVFVWGVQGPSHMAAPRWRRQCPIELQ